MIDAKTKEIATGLQQALLANDAPAIAGGVSALSIHLGGDSLSETAGMPAASYVLYLLCEVIKVLAPEGRVVNLHGVPVDPLKLL